MRILIHANRPLGTMLHTQTASQAEFLFVGLFIPIEYDSRKLADAGAGATVPAYSVIMVHGVARIGVHGQDPG